ncbi:TM2 domain-containing protein [Allosphingosinicella deserti]|uniref:TM2 domain-containing protein n=1 Tax=Allosphingosinicella deserti TaxID=2116704 RepID=A0A2P7QNC6_9SPHN|nr:TM2 domain-containing protein [Sphingomonas deserti]PSJ39475.1 TM2 domain-containing protein [Sphingomonas deserti]
MRGQVLGVDTRTGDGIVLGDDGRRYTFRPRDWADRGEPAVGLQVDFETDQSRALSIFPVPGAVPVRPAVAVAHPGGAPVANDRNKYIAALIAFAFGPLGIHRFYLGRTGTGILMLVLSCTIIGLLLSVPWAFVDMIRYLIMSEREFASRYSRITD